MGDLGHNSACIALVLHLSLLNRVFSISEVLATAIQ